MSKSPVTPQPDGPRRTRLPAEVRRAQLVAAAAGHFARTSYRGATMADLAGAAGVTAALAYRHFPSKAELFAACVEHEWLQLRSRWDEVLAAGPHPSERLLALANAFVVAGDGVATLVSLWFQAVAEAHAEPVLQAAFVRTLGQLHEYLEAVAEGSVDEPDGMVPGRDAQVEAWVFIGVGMLVAADMRTGMQMLALLPAINRERVSWLYGPEAAARLFR